MGKVSAMWWQTVAEQLTVESTPMKLRVPTLPDGRRKPSKLARSLSGTKAVGLRLAAEGVVAGEVVHLDVVHVDVLAGLDVRRTRSR